MNNFYVFGLSFGGRQFVRKCIKYGYKINAILDNDKKKMGKNFVVFQLCFRKTL